MPFVEGSNPPQGDVNTYFRMAIGTYIQYNNDYYPYKYPAVTLYLNGMEKGAITRL